MEDKLFIYFQLFLRFYIWNLVGNKMINFQEEPLNTTLKDSGIQIAFSWKNKKNLDLIGGGYGFIYLELVDYHLNEDRSQTKYYVTQGFDYHKWTEEEFPRDVNSTQRTTWDNTLYWFNQTDMMKILRHGNDSENQTFFEVFGVAWSPGYDCPSGAHDEFLNSMIFIHIRNKFYDISDIHNPVKEYFDDSYLFPTSLTGYTYSELLLVRNYYKISDWFSFYREKAYSLFYSVERKYTHTVNDVEGLKTRIHFKSSFHGNLYDTTVLSIFDVLGWIGGIYEIMYVSISFFLKFFSLNILNSEIKKTLKTKKSQGWFSYPIHKYDYVKSVILNLNLMLF